MNSVRVTRIVRVMSLVETVANPGARLALRAGRPLSACATVTARHVIMRIAYTNATIWTAAGPPIPGATLLVEGGTIVGVGTDLDTSGATEVD